MQVHMKVSSWLLNHSWVTGQDYHEDLVKVSMQVSGMAL